ncbi:multicopper oxidase family protein [Streptantibioticus rubrisoli]|uniref:Multicopper oxidase domain-containing protein n=1 Tax=Streptantibioticus rubrisoli TaxID=1387313 RepID=A0ABT1PEW5_9ACTN|nr:multicopper oxidase domain-containing protein [Streptantibioticus rubrisoli]MCQ4043907.1 multicopper oxidase domain-containing protein [Streptantibioticus rubrisoli]
MKRRRFLAATAGTGLAAGTPLSGRLLKPHRPGLPMPLRSAAPLPRPYQVPLPIPAVLRPVRSDATTDHYEITQQVAHLRILPGLETEAWTYDGSYPGPTLVSRSGRRTVVTHRNELPQPVAVHLHGGHTPHDSDGHPTDLILPVGWSRRHRYAMADTSGLARTALGERTYTYPLDQRAATLWYHDHRMGFTGPSAYRGLAGFHLVHDDEEERLPLPRGERDIPLMITDRSFTADGSFHYPAVDPEWGMPGVTHHWMEGVLGDTILVNGAPWPVLDVRRQRYRLRLLNAANSRILRLELDPQPPGGDALVQIGADGGLLERPVRHDALAMAPAERFDVVVDFARYRPGTRVRLVNRLGSGTTAEVMRFDVSGAARAPVDDTAVPDRLSTVERLDPRRAMAVRTFYFRRTAAGWTINGMPYRPGRALAAPKLGTTELWRIVSDFHHPIHVHLNPFQVVARDGGAPGRYDAGWKDTVDVLPGKSAEIAVRFTDYSGRFLFHCHNLEHEDMAMMADFVTR